MSDLKSNTCAIIGGGPAGLAAALSLCKYTSIKPTVYELRSEPSTLGGAINLTPCGIMQLQHLGIKEVPGCETEEMEIMSMRTGSKVGAIPLSCSIGHAKRTLRADLQRTMLDQAENLGIAVHYSAQLTGVEELPDGVRLLFRDSKVQEYDFVLGCDGIFSAVRNKYVDPQREIQYMGPIAVFAVVPTAQIKATIPFEGVCASVGTSGFFLMSHCNAERSKMFFTAGLPQDKAPETRKDWLIWRDDKDKTLEEVRSRFKGSKLEAVDEIIDSIEELSCYALCKLPNEGQWHKGRALLLGDAAHAMPPQGESTGYAIEDAILLGRVIAEQPQLSIENVFRTYEKTRRPRISDAWKESTERGGIASPSNKVIAYIFEWVMWVGLRVFVRAWTKRMSYDVRQEPIVM